MDREEPFRGMVLGVLLSLPLWVGVLLWMR